MFVFVCAGCGTELTVPQSQVALPVHARQKYGNGIQLPVLMESGTFAVDPEPWGRPWRRWEEVDPDEAAARGIYAPVYTMSDGAPGATVIAPGDVSSRRTWTAASSDRPATRAAAQIAAPGASGRPSSSVASDDGSGRGRAGKVPHSSPGVRKQR